jgi:hypothetical protein
MTQEERKLVELGVDTLQTISARLLDLKSTIDMLFFMTEKHQKEVRDLLKGMQP